MRFASIFSATALLGMTMAAMATAAAVDILTPSSSPTTPTEQGNSSQVGVQNSRDVVQEAPESHGFRFQTPECKACITKKLKTNVHWRHHEAQEECAYNKDYTHECPSALWPKCEDCIDRHITGASVTRRVAEEMCAFGSPGYHSCPSMTWPHCESCIDSFLYNRALNVKYETAQYYCYQQRLCPPGAPFFRHCAMCIELYLSASPEYNPREAQYHCAAQHPFVAALCPTPEPRS